MEPVKVFKFYEGKGFATAIAINPEEQKNFEKIHEITKMGHAKGAIVNAGAGELILVEISQKQYVLPVCGLCYIFKDLS